MAGGPTIQKIVQLLSGSSPRSLDIDLAAVHPDGSMDPSQWHVEATMVHYDSVYACAVQNSCSATVQSGSLNILPATFTHPEKFGVNVITVTFSNPSGTTLRITVTKVAGAAPIAGHLAVSLFGSQGTA